MTVLVQVIAQRPHRPQASEVATHDRHRPLRAAFEFRILQLEANGLRTLRPDAAFERRVIGRWVGDFLPAAHLRFDRDPVERLPVRRSRRLDDFEAALPGLEVLVEFLANLFLVELRQVGPAASRADVLAPVVVYNKSTSTSPDSS
jgi:hypothetical protein